MGDAVSSDGVETQTKKKAVENLTLKSSETNAKKRVRFQPEDKLVEIHEISPRLNTSLSLDSNESSDSDDSSESSLSDEESDDTTSSSDSDKVTSHPLKDKLKTEKIITNAKNRALPSPMINKVASNKKLSLTAVVKTNQSVLVDRQGGGDFILPVSNSNKKISAQKTKRSNLPAPKVLKAVSTKVATSNNVRENVTSSKKFTPVSKNEPNVLNRKKINTIRASSSATSESKIEEAVIRLSKSLQSLTVENNFIFPPNMTPDDNLPVFPSITKRPSYISNNEIVNRVGKLKTSKLNNATDNRSTHLRVDSGRRRAAWQMANSKAEDTLETKPRIFQLWET